MCYYAQTTYTCGDWKWGNMTERCPRQPRIGETCGAKLVAEEQVVRKNEECKVCQEIGVKQRKIQKLRDNIYRWNAEGSSFQASLEKAKREAIELAQKVKSLESRRMVNVYADRRQGTGVLPPRGEPDGGIQETYSWYPLGSSSSSGYTPLPPMAGGYETLSGTSTQTSQLPRMSTNLSSRHRPN